MVDFPTHSSPSCSVSCLDLVITNRPRLVRSIDQAPPLGMSDHIQIVCTLCYAPISNYFPNSSTGPPSSLYRFKQVPSHLWQLVNADLAGYNWSSLNSYTDVNDALHHFDCELQSAFRLYLTSFGATHTVTSPRPRMQSPPWVTAELRSAVKRKRDRYSVYKKYPTAVNHAAYNRQRIAVKHLSRQAHRQYIRSIQASLTSPNRPTLFQFVRAQRHTSGRVMPQTMIASDGTVATSPKSIADVLNTQFTSFGLPDDPSWRIPPLSQSPFISVPFRTITVTTFQVRKYLKRLKCGKSPGSDGIPNEVLQSLAPSIAYPLAIIFNMSFRTGTFPQDWKSAIVTPLYKNKGSRACPANYRPISLLRTVSKLCERIVFDSLYLHIAPALSPAQSGFCRGDSTQYQVTRLVQDIATKRNCGEHVGMVFFDLAKAFDTVWHRGLLAKLEATFRVEDAALRWISSYLSARSQAVRLPYFLSDPLPVTSGVPQGSILGPLLFLLYVNDLPSVVPDVSLYADDTGLICSDPSPAQLLLTMQHRINSTVMWMQTWKLQPNLDKTEAMYISSSPPDQPLYFPDSTMPIRVVTQHKHLGVMFDCKLSWAAHVNCVCKRTSSALGVLQPHCTTIILSFAHPV